MMIQIFLENNVIFVNIVSSINYLSILLLINKFLQITKIINIFEF